MDLKCQNPKCNASLLKSYGDTYKLRSRHVRWDNIGETATVQCNICRSWNDMPLTLRMENVGLVLEVGIDIRKSSDKEKLIITEKVNKDDKAH